jgi:hypothetical protein
MYIYTHTQTHTRARAHTHTHTHTHTRVSYVYIRAPSLSVPGEHTTVQLNVTLSGATTTSRHIIVSFPHSGGSGQGGYEGGCLSQGGGGLLCLTRELDMGVVHPGVAGWGAGTATRLVHVEAVRAGLARLPHCLVLDAISGESFSVALPSVTTILP